MSSKTSVTTVSYTRSSILAWVNAIFGSAHLTFQDIPCHDVVLLLYGIFNTDPSTTHVEPTAITADNGTSPTTTVPLLSAAEVQTHAACHQATCARFLQLIQFPAPSCATTTATASRVHTVSPTSAVSVSSPTTAEERSANAVTATAAAVVTQQRNAEHVLAMIRALSAEEAELLRTCATIAQDDDDNNRNSSSSSSSSNGSNGGEVARAGNTANVVLLLGPSMTPTVWLSGCAFVEELKLWRWVRLMADRHRRTTPSIRAVIADYLQQDVAYHPSAVSLVHVAAEKRQRSASPVPEQEKERNMEGHGARDGHDEAQTKTNAVVSNSTANATETNTDVSTTSCDAHASLRGRARRLEASPSPVPVLTTPATALLSHPLSPVHALLSPIRDDERRVCPEHSGTETSAVAAAAAFEEARAATETSCMAQVLPLQQALHAAQTALEQAMHDAAVKVANATASSTHSSAGAAESGEDAVVLPSSVARQPLLPALHNSREDQETRCRQRMVTRVFASAADTRAEVDAPGERCGGNDCLHIISSSSQHNSSSYSSPSATAGAGGGCATLAAPPCCDVCPAMMAHAIQCNLNAIDALEEARTKAIAACLKKDPLALLAALQNIV